MHIRKALISTIAASLLVIPLAAQHGGGQRPSGSQGQRPGMGSQQPRGQAGQRPDAGREGTRDQQRQQIHATDQQRDQIRACDQSADRVRQQARDMAKAAKGGGFNNEEFRRQHEQLRQEIRTMQQEHERLRQSLSDEQQAAMQDRLQAMDRERERLNARLQEMEQGLEQPTPDGKRVAQQARNLEQAMRHWQKQHHNFSADLGANE